MQQVAALKVGRLLDGGVTHEARLLRAAVALYNSAESSLKAARHQALRFAGDLPIDVYVRRRWATRG